MSAERERRAQLELAQDRVRRAQAALAAAPDVEDELAPLRDEQLRLERELAPLQAQVDARETALAASQAALGRAQRVRWGGLGARAVLFVGGLLGAAVGAAAGALVLAWLAASATPTMGLGAVALAGSVALAGIAWVLGRAS